MNRTEKDTSRFSVQTLPGDWFFISESGNKNELRLRKTVRMLRKTEKRYDIY